MRCHGLTRVTDALAEHQGTNQAGNAGVDVNHRAACEVESAPAEDETCVSLDLFELGLGDGPCRVVSGCSHSLGCVADGIRAAPVPDHVRDGEVDQRDPERHENQQRREFDALGEGTDDQRRRDAGEGHLEGHVNIFGNDDAIREGGDRRLRRDADEESLGQAAHIIVQASAIRKGERIAEHDPEDRDKRNDHEDLAQDRQHVLRAHQTAIEQGQARNRHHQDEQGGDNHPGGIALVGNGCSRCLGQGHAGRHRQ